MGKPRNELNVELCGAMSRTTGKPCRQIAGQRTEHQGIGRCWLHGGRTESHKRHAVNVEVKRRMATYGEPLDEITAPAALMGLLRATSGHVSWLQAEVAALDSLGERDAEVLLKLYDSEREMLRRVAESCVKAGVAEAIVRAEEARVSEIVAGIERACNDIRLSPGQKKALGVALRKQLAVAHGEEPDADADDRIRDALAEDGPPVEWIESAAT